MAEGRSILRTVRAIFDRSSAKKMESEFEQSLKQAGEKGGGAAGKGFLREMRAEFDKKKAQLAEQLAAGTIDQKQFRKQSELAARQFNSSMLKSIEEARRSGQLTDNEYVKLTRSLKRVGDTGASAFDRIKRGIVAAGGALAVAFGVRAISRFVRGSIDAFEELRTGQRQLEQQLANTGIAWNAVSDEVRAHARALWDTHRLTEGEVQGTLRQLVLVTGDYEKSLRSVGLAHDLMAATGMNAEQAARAIGRIMNGDLNVLSRYGIELTGAGDAVQHLTELLHGQALAATSARDTWAKAMGDLRETIGGLITAAFGLDEAFDVATGSVRKLNDALAENGDEIGRQGRNLVAFGTTLWRSFWIVTQGIGSAVSGVVGGILAVINIVPKALNGLIAQVNRIPGVNIDVTLGMLPADKFFAEMRTANERVENSVSAIANAWRAVDTEAGKAGATVRSFTDRGEGTTAVGGGTSPAAQRDLEAEALARLEAQREAHIASLVREIDVLGRQAAAWALGEEAVAALNRELHIENALIAAGAEVGTEHADVIGQLAAAQYDAAAAAEEAANSVVSDWSDAADAIEEQWARLPGLMQGVGMAMADGGIRGLARFANAKAKEAFAMALGATARGIMALANPVAAALKGETAAGHFAAAAQFGAEATAWKALGGAGGRPPASSGAAGAAAPPSGSARNSQPPGAEVHIHMHGDFDALSPRVQSVVYDATQRATQRYGQNARIYTHTGGAG